MTTGNAASSILSALVRRGVLMGAVVLGGCRPEPRGIEGEWALRLTLDQPGSGARALPGQQMRGILVIDSRIPDVYESLPESADSLPFTPGRVYLGPIVAPAAADSPYDFRPGIQHDVFEEALALAGPADGFRAELMPGVTHVGISLEGKRSADQVTGRWVQDAYVGEVGARGTFVMRRTRRTAMTDSALRRSARARRERDRGSR